MPRNFPNDVTGDVLVRLQNSGDSLEAPRDIDFSVIFDSEEGAREFCDKLVVGDLKIKCKRADDDANYEWDVTVTRHMIPTHAGITEFEDELERLAGPFGGSNDGWGCFAQVSEAIQAKVRAAIEGK